MTDKLVHTIPDINEQRNFAELREEFRAQHLADLRSQMVNHYLGLNVIGDPDRSRVHYTPETWAAEMLKRLDEVVIQDFGLGEVPEKMGSQLEDLAHKASLHESVTWDDQVEGVVDHDGPPLGPLENLSDDQICDYVNATIKESALGKI